MNVHIVLMPNPVLYGKGRCSWNIAFTLKRRLDGSVESKTSSLISLLACIQNKLFNYYNYHLALIYNLHDIL